MINCKLYRYDAGGFREITSQMQGYIIPAKCYSAIEAYDENIEFFSTYTYEGTPMSEEVHHLYKFDFAKMQATKIKMDTYTAATSHPQTGQIYTFVADETNVKVLVQNEMGADAKTFVTFPEYELLGRGSALSDQSSIRFSP